MSKAMEPIQSVTNKLFSTMAERYYPNGSVFRCIPCKKQRNCTTSEIAEGMSKGWPRCKVCGHMVDLVTPRDERSARR